MTPAPESQPKSHGGGPVTDAGKLRSSANAVKTALASPRPKHPYLPGEAVVYDEFTRDVVEGLKPVGSIENALASDIAMDLYRLRHGKKMERDLFDYLEDSSPDAPTRLVAHALAWTDKTKGLQNMALYIQRIQNTVTRNLKELKERQAERKAAEQKALEEAIALTQLAESKGETYDPAADFPAVGDPGEFVYSTEEIHRLIGRAARLEEAKMALAS